MINSQRRICDLIGIDNNNCTDKIAHEIADNLYSILQSKLKVHLEKVITNFERNYNKIIDKIIIVGAGQDIILDPAFQDMNLNTIKGNILMENSNYNLQGVKSNFETSLGMAFLGYKLKYLNESNEH